MPKKRTEADVTEGGARRRPGGQGWSGPPPTREALAARGARKRSLYLSPERAAQLERLRIALSLPEEGSLGAVWARAADALEREVEAQKKKEEAEKG